MATGQPERNDPRPILRSSAHTEPFGNSDVMAWLSSVSVELQESNAENRAMAARIRELEAKLEARIRLSDEELLAQLPARTGRVLQSAIEAAEEIVATGKQQVSALSDAARREADGIVAKAEQVARTLVEEATARAHELIGSAERSRQRTLAEAEEQRSQILFDLELRRAELGDDIEGLEAGLLQLREAHEAAKRSVDAALDRFSGAGTSRSQPEPQRGKEPVKPPESSDRHAARGATSGGTIPVRPGRPRDAHALRILLVADGDQFRSLWTVHVLTRHGNETTNSSVLLRLAHVTNEGAVPPAIFTALERKGLSVRSFRSAKLSKEMIDKSDLILGMTTDDAHHVLGFARAAAARIFTLRELVRTGDAVGPRRPDESLRQWLERLNVERVDAVVFSPDGDDIVSPQGRGKRYYQDTAEELLHHITRLGTLLWPETWEARSRRGPHSAASISNGSHPANGTSGLRSDVAATL